MNVKGVKLENNKVVIGTFITAIALIFGLINGNPFAMKGDIENLQRDLDAVMALKNQDNAWYRELRETVAVMKTDLRHAKDDVQEIKRLVRKP